MSWGQAKTMYSHQRFFWKTQKGLGLLGKQAGTAPVAAGSTIALYLLLIQFRASPIASAIVICIPKYSVASLKICGFSSLLVSLIFIYTEFMILSNEVYPKWFLENAFSLVGMGRPVVSMPCPAPHRGKNPEAHILISLFPVGKVLVRTQVS